jgi:DNA replication protein DnaC
MVTTRVCSRAWLGCRWFVAVPRTLDDWGITPLTAEQRRDLLEIVDDRHGRASTVVTSQLPVTHWHEHIGNPTIADAVLDRLVHSAHRIELKGESLRKLRAIKPVRLDETAGC